MIVYESVSDCLGVVCHFTLGNTINIRNESKSNSVGFFWACHALDILAVCASFAVSTDTPGKLHSLHSNSAAVW